MDRKIVDEILKMDLNVCGWGFIIIPEVFTLFIPVLVCEWVFVPKRNA